MTAPEFSRPERVDRIGEVPRQVAIEAEAAERAALAKRFDLIAIDSLTAEIGLAREAAGIRATGGVRARVVQRCSVTGDPVPAEIDEPVALIFVAEGEAADAEIELSAEALDMVAFDGAVIDLGEAAAETMALALDPFPRGPGAAAALRAAGVLQEGEAGPFGALAALLTPPEK